MPPTRLVDLKLKCIFEYIELIDYQAAYELMKRENEQLKQTVMNMQKELEENSKVKILNSNKFYIVLVFLKTRKSFEIKIYFIL